MTKSLLVFCSIVASTLTTFAQYQILPEDSLFVQQAIEHGLDSADFPGFVHLKKYGVPISHNSSEFRMGPEQNGAPLFFIGNPGFESADFTSWTGTIGDNTSSSAGPLQNQVNGIFTGALDPAYNDANARHNIMSSGVGIDPEGGFSVVPLACGYYTARLGNTTSNYQGQSLSQSWVVTAADTAVTFCYAVVMYDGSHGVNEGSYFEYEIRDQNSNIIFAGHDESSILTAAYQPAVSPGTFYRAWTTEVFDLTTHIGQTVTIQFTAAGCIFGGHYCYAYVDVNPNNANTIGVEEYNREVFTIYPNPSTDGIFAVNFSSNTVLEMPRVYDCSGREIDAKCTRTSSGWNIDISHTPKGSYFAQIATSEGVKHCNLIH